MLNKPLKIKKIVMICMAQIFWLSCLCLQAQNKQVNHDGAEKKQVPTPQKVSLSNQDPNKKLADDAAAKRIAADQKRKQDLAIEQKKQAEACEKSAASTPKNQHASTSAKAPANQNAQPISNTQNVKAENIAKDWELKKAKISADLKAKGYTQYDIDKHIAAMEKEMNINNKSNK